MKMYLLLVLLAMAMGMLIMYYLLCKTHPELISGFIVLIGVGISHILNSAEDILAILFKTEDTITHTVSSAAGPIVTPVSPPFQSQSFNHIATEEVK